MSSVEQSGNSQYFVDASVKTTYGKGFSSGFFRITDIDSDSEQKVITVDSKFKKFVLDSLSFFHIIDKPVYVTAKELSNKNIFKSEFALGESVQTLALMCLAEELKTSAAPDILDKYNEAEKARFVEVVHDIAQINLSKNSQDKKLQFTNKLLKIECANKLINEKMQKIYLSGIDFTTGVQDIKLLTDHFLNAEDPIAAWDSHFSSVGVKGLTPLEVALFINKNRFKLPLADTHSLMQRAIEVICESNLQGIDPAVDRHVRLYQLQKTPCAFKPSQEEVCGTKASINIAHFSEVRGNVAVKREDLPPQATLLAWEQLKENLRQKVESNPLAKQTLQSYGTTWNEVWELSLRAEYLTNLLASSGSKVGLTEAKFRAILQSILDLDTKPRPGHVFTEQEEALIKITMTIKNCPTGKSEGIDGIYEVLDQKYRYNVKLLRSDEERPMQFVNQVVQNLVANQLKGEHPPILQELTGWYFVPQTAHQVLYVKNLIGNIIGLEHELTLDRTGITTKSLLDKTREEVLAVFFKHVTPTTIAQELMRVVNANLKENSKIISPLIPGITADDDWDYQDEDGSFTLNEHGAIKILQATGWLTTEHTTPLD